MRYARAVRRIHTAELLSIGTELTTGGTRDTNAGDLARSLTDRGAWVGRMTALPDDLEAASGAIRDALERADLVVTTGGLGPTPDDLTREAIAAAVGEGVAVDPALEDWLRSIWRRRGLPFPAANIKQAWRIPSATAIPNGHGTAPGWWVDRPDGRIVVALPGPPREMTPMWRDHVLPRLHDRGLGVDRSVRVLRLHGIGESQLADELDDLLRGRNPVVATYARADAVDVRVTAVDEPGDDERPPRPAAEIGEAALLELRARLGRYIWAEDDESWARAIGRALAERGGDLATVEAGTGAQLAGLLAGSGRLRRAVAIAEAGDLDPVSVAEEARRAAGATHGLAVLALPQHHDTTIHVAVVRDGQPGWTASHVVFQQGAAGHLRAAVAAAADLLAVLRETGPGDPGAAEPGAAEPGAGASPPAAR